jgi:DNA-binding response OmpR family regulator
MAFTVSLGIADDEPDILRLLNMVLSQRGYPIAYLASNGDEVVELNRKSPADVLIIDNIMPFKSGIEAVREIVREYPETRIFLMTCGEDVDTIEGIGDITIIKKPFRLKDLVAMVSLSNGRSTSEEKYSASSSEAKYF